MVFFRKIDLCIKTITEYTSWKKSTLTQNSQAIKLPKKEITEITHWKAICAFSVFLWLGTTFNYWFSSNGEVEVSDFSCSLKPPEINISEN